MLNLNGSTESLVLVLGGSVAVDYTTHYDTLSSPGTEQPGDKQGQITDTTITAIVAAPNDGFVRRVKFITARNVGVSSVTATFKKKVSSSYYVLGPAFSLQAGEAVQWSESEGFILLASDGRRKTDAINNGNSPTIRLPVGGVRTAALTAVKTCTNTTAFAVYMGKATRAVSSVSVRCRVTQALATGITGELAIATGAPGAFGATSSLTVVGYADVAATFNSTGLKTTTINVSSGQQINAGDDVWIVFYGNATTPLIIRGMDAADDIQTGCQAAAATTQPSTVVGTPTTFTVEGATVLPPWVAVQGL